MTRLRYVHKIRDAQGVERHYFRFGKLRVRVRGEPGSPEYLAHHDKLLRVVRLDEFRQLAPQFRKLSSPGRREAGASHVYLIEADEGPIKIGVSSDVALRRSTLAHSNPKKLTVLRSHRTSQKGLAFHIESGFKELMRPNRLCGEWFDCDEILAIVALHVVESGDLAGCAAVRAAIADRFAGMPALHRYARELFQRSPECFALVKKSTRLVLAWAEPRPQPAISIYPEEWNKARLEAARRKREDGVLACGKF
jgi:predicted GIY-YIG superfamily endonuclease